MGSVERRVQQWIDLTGDLISRPGATFPHRLLSARLHEAFGCQVSWNWMDASGGMGFVLHVPIPGWPTPDVESDLAPLTAHHPLFRWHGVTGDLAAMSIGRVPRALVTDQGRAIVRDHLAPIGMEQQLSIPYRSGTHHHRAFVLARDRKDFSEEDLEVARQLQPLLRLLDRQCAVRQTGVQASQTTSAVTGRELAVLRLLADGLTAYSIGTRLSISPRTVHRHLQSLYCKLGVSDRIRAVLVGRDSGLLTDGPDPTTAAAAPSVGQMVGDATPLG